MEAGEFEQAFVGFGAAVAEDDAAGTATQREGVGEFALRLIAIEIADVDELAGLLGDALHPMRVGVADGVDGDTGGEVEVALAGGVPDVRPLPLHERDGRSAVVMGDVGRVVRGGGV